MSVSGRTANERAWIAVRDAAVLDGLDEAAARDEADELLAAAAQGRGDWRERARAKVWSDVAPWLAALAALCCIGAISYSIVAFVPWGHASYAGVQDRHVRDRAFEAVTGWYGYNDLPPQLRVTSVAKTFYLGRRSWKVSYRALDGTRVCAYVFSHGAGKGHRVDSDYAQVHEGAACA